MSRSLSVDNSFSYFDDYNSQPKLMTEIIDEVYDN
jgi:hypothetical protein